jgi:hypothetical protein
MKQNIKRGLKFGIPVIIFFTVLISWIGGFREGFLPGLIIGLIIGGVFALLISCVNSDTAKESFAEFRWDKEKRARMKTNFKKLLPNFAILFMGALLTRYTGKIYLFFLISVSLCLAVSFLQSFKTGEYKKLKAEGELTAYYALLFTLPVSFLSTYVIFLLLIFGGDVQAIIKLLQ